jgi:hypothetical protein
METKRGQLTLTRSRFEMNLACQNSDHTKDEIGPKTQEKHEQLVQAQPYPFAHGWTVRPGTERIIRVEGAEIGPHAQHTGGDFEADRPVNFLTYPLNTKPFMRYIFYRTIVVIVFQVNFFIPISVGCNLLISDLRLGRIQLQPASAPFPLTETAAFSVKAQ